MIKDKRSLRTRELLTQELISLLLTKPLSEITVTELTEATDLNRATFYLHYANIYDLFQSIEDDLIEQVERWIKQSFPMGASAYYLETDVEGNPIMPILTEMFNFIYNNRCHNGTAAILRAGCSNVSTVKDVIVSSILHYLRIIQSITTVTAMLWTIVSGYYWRDPTGLTMISTLIRKR